MIGLVKAGDRPVKTGVVGWGASAVVEGAGGRGSAGMAVDGGAGFAAGGGRGARRQGR